MQKRGFQAGSKVLVVSKPAVEALYARPLAGGPDGAGFETSLLAVPGRGMTRKTPATCGPDPRRLPPARAGAWSCDRGPRRRGGGRHGRALPAATWPAGYRVVQVPTTFALGDGGRRDAVGQDRGWNHPGGKNLIGASHQPRLVLIDPSTWPAWAGPGIPGPGIGRSDQVRRDRAIPELSAAWRGPDSLPAARRGPLCWQTRWSARAAAKARCGGGR